MSDSEVAVEGGLDEPTELEPDQGSLELSSPEDAHTREEWEAAAAAVLRKARRLGEDDPDDAVWAKLSRTTLDGVGLVPLGTPDLTDDPVTSGRPTREGAWDIRAHHGAGAADVETVNEAALADLEGGCTSLWLDVAPDADWARLLDGVLLDLAAVVLRPTGDPVATAGSFLDHVGDRELHRATNLGIPVVAADAEVLARSRRAGVLGFVVDATVVHDRGASDAQELGHALAEAIGFLRVMEDAGVPVDEAARSVEMRLCAGVEQFPTIAKLRAARRLWARVLELSGVEPAPLRLHAVTSRPMMSRYDPYVNLLRTTVAAFAAGVGGADAVTVLPFDAPLGRPEAFGRRLARNISALLIEESHVAVVADPAGGAWALERLTDDLAQAAWAVLGRIEAGESLDDLVAATRQERERQIATRRRPITGLTEFPAAGEVLPVREPDGGFAEVRGYGASFEAMRDDPPAGRVLLATMGTVAAHTARATFASNLLTAGGIDVDVAGPTEGPEDLIAAYAGQPVVCLAGSDAAYREWGAAAAAALREAGATRVVLAGTPADGEDWTDDSCAMGLDALAFLTRTREALR